MRGNMGTSYKKAKRSALTQSEGTDVLAGGRNGHYGRLTASIAIGCNGWL